MSRALLIRNAEVEGVRADVRIENGLIAAIGEVSRANADEIDAKGGALIPGLHDHHLHLFATAARLASIDLSGARAKDDLLSLLRENSATKAPEEWLRGFGYDESEMGVFARADLDETNIPNPIRIQDRTGALWILNSRALDLVLDDAPPPCVEHDGNGRPTGRIWRGDAWLRTRIQSTPPSLTGLSRTLASYGVTGVTDTSVTNGPGEARLFAGARQNGALLQSLHLMSGGEIAPSPDYTIGPLKILPDERDLPELDAVVDKMRLARSLDRNIAVHCVTAAELVLALAAFETVGARRGDRLEHGGIVPQAMFDSLRGLGLTIVTQPNFIFDRGDRYTRTIEAHELPDLYRLGSLRAAGIKLAAGSDAPYGGFDPWSAIKAAATRATKSGIILGPGERIPARDALGLYLGPAHDPAGGERKIEIGAIADLCLLKTSLKDALAAPDAALAAATIARGELIYMKN